MTTTKKPGDRRADSQQLVRQWTLLQLLCGTTSGLGVKQLAEQLDVTKATIERDLATLEREFAIVARPVGKQKKVYRIDQRIRALETLQFGSSQLLAIYAALAGLHHWRGTPLHDDLEQVRLKIRGALGARHAGGLDALQRVFTPHARGFVDYGPHGEHIDELVDAIARRRICRMTYHARWKGTTRVHEIRPLRLVWYRASLYLLACCDDKERLTTFAVHRIQELEKTGSEFAPPPGVDVDAHVARAFGIFVSDYEEEVEVLFDQEIAWRIEEQTFHPKEQKHRLPDGRLLYRVRSSAQWEIIPWVRSFGPLAELMAPREWRDELRTSLEVAAARYRTGDRAER